MTMNPSNQPEPKCLYSWMDPDGPARQDNYECQLAPHHPGKHQDGDATYDPDETNKNSVTSASPAVKQNSPVKERVSQPSQHFEAPVRGTDSSIPDAQGEVGLREKIMQLLPHGPCQCNLGKECVSDTNYYADELIALFQADKAAAVAEAQKRRTFVIADLMNCLGRLRGLGHPADEIEKKYYVEAARLQPPTAGEGESGETQQCESCGGVGWNYPDAPWGVSQSKSGGKHIKCHDCNGKGIITPNQRERE